MDAPDASVTVPRAEPTPCANTVAEKLSATANQVTSAANFILFTGTSTRRSKKLVFRPSIFALLPRDPTFSARRPFVVKRKIPVFLSSCDMDNRYSSGLGLH